MNKIDFQRCNSCINDTYDQGISFDTLGVCNYCKQYAEDRENLLFQDKDGVSRFKKIVEEIKDNTNKHYDCVIGLSGGVDSTFLAYKLKEYDLRVLAVHVDGGWNTELSVSNIEKILEYTKFDLETVVIEWGEMRDLQLSYLRAGIMNQDIPQDHAFFAGLYNTAIKLGIKYVFTGSNLQTEGLMGYFGHNAMDKTYLEDVFSKNSNGRLKKYPRVSFFQYYFLIPFWYKVKVIKPFNYLGYNKDKATDILVEEVSYQKYKHKHGESVWTRFFQDYYLPKKFNFDKRKTHLSSQVFNGDITREEALKAVEISNYDLSDLEFDCDYIARKLEVDIEEFKSFLDPADSDPKIFKTQTRKYLLLKKVQRILQKALGKKLSNYS